MKTDTANLIHKAGAHLSSGNTKLASKYCRRAIDTNPDTIEYWWELGGLSARLECFPETERCCREVIARNPSIPEAHLYLGIALQRQDRLEEAKSSLQDAIRLRADLGDAYYYLGIVQQAMEEIDAAVQNYRRALDFGYEPVSSSYNMSLLLRQGKPVEALECAYQALSGQPGNLRYRQNFTRALRAAAPVRVRPAMRDEIMRCFSTRGIDTAALMKPGMMLLATDESLNRLVQLAVSGSGDEIMAGLAGGTLREIFSDNLLRALLTHTKIASVEFQRLAIALRRIALEWAQHGSEVLPQGLYDEDGSFLVALASQHFNIDYAAPVAVEEYAAIRRLILDVDNRMQAGVAQAAGFSNRVVVLCMYQPFYALAGAEGVAESMQDKPASPLQHLLKIQWFDHVEEISLRSGIKTLTPVNDRISAAVREQYEDSPYPRWNSVNLLTPQPYADALKKRFPGFTAPDFGQSGIDILIAGCGTGRHAIMSATNYMGARVLAVDLSLASLAYAMRRAHEFSIDNIRFAQADILELGSYEGRFHIVESVGVLHHMDNPEAGLNILAGLLHDGGLMQIGLYSELGRRDVAAARAWISEQGYPATPDGIRQARVDLAGLGPDHPAHSVFRFSDFYTLSECRDLLFHVQEHRFRLADIGAMLDRCGLGFVGFTSLDPQTLLHYRKHYPDDPSMTNLSNWAEFEAANPDSFAEMYQFMCQKI